MPPSKKTNKKTNPNSSLDDAGEINDLIQGLVRKRANLKGKLSRFHNYFNKVKDEEPNKATLLELEMRLKEIESSLLSEFSEVQFELEGLDPITYNESDLETFESSYFSLLSEIKQFFLAYYSSNCNQTPSQAQGAPGTGSGLPQGSAAIRKVNAKLPVIELPKFSGQYERWLEFRDLYVSLVHNCDNLEPIEKFHYLRASLEGAAAQCIQSINFCAENYDIAWDIVCQRFENKRLMVHTHIKALFNIYDVKPDSSSSFRNLVDLISRNLRSLENLGVNTTSWDPLIIYMVTSKLDVDSIREWEQTEFNDVLPSLSELKQFLTSRADFLDKISMHKAKPKKTFYSGQQNKKVNFSCFYCKQQHSIYSCKKFLDLSVEQRQSKVESLKLCANCLLSGHKVQKCRSGHCRYCKQNHNTLLHPNNDKLNKGNSSVSCDSSTESQGSNHEQVTLFNSSKGQVLLATAVVEVKDKNNKKHSCRVLLDNASMSNFITKDLADKLGLKQNKINSTISGIGQSFSSINSSCDVEISSCYSNYKVKINCLVISHITSNLPNMFFDPGSLDIPSYCHLADPKFYEPTQVDMLVGADTFWDLMCNNKISLGKNKPVIQKSKLGWIISGPLGISNNKNISCHLSKTLDLEKQLSMFWEIEELSSKPILSEEEQNAESHFSKSFERNHDGRFIVAIPLKGSPDQLGDSKSQAVKQFQSLERKLARHPQLKTMYIDFMTEYQDLNHMSPCVPEENQVTFFSPHHGVLREDSSTTKLRVVFNSSSPSSSGLSYNSIQMVGPVVQEDLLSIILRFRQHQYVISADICKMYRQILVKEEFRPLQLILWRDDPNKDLQTFSLNTVTYGTASAPFLATRCLKQLALEHESSNPRASQVISRDFYVDDLLSGADSIDEAVQLCQDVSSILRSGCFELRKWKSNSKKVLEKFKATGSSQDSYFFGSSEFSKTLGMLWSCEEDKLLFHIKVIPTTTKITKRVILSEVSKIYDPLGLISPVVVRAKVILQVLWSLKLSWDDQVPFDLSQKWINFRSELNALNFLKISRCILCQNPSSVQLHGFSDASNSAYGACIYIRSVDPSGNVCVELLTSKTRVAPLKSITIPRLELCAGLLLAQLFDKVKNSLTLNFGKVFLWCDSTVTLAWIRSSASNLQVFVGNRVSKIQGLTSSECWRYVPSEHNPADILSRGMSPKDLATSDTWFHGPSWLRESSDNWPVDISIYKSLPLDELPEVRKSAQTFIQVNHNELFPFNRFSSLTRIIRVMAYCLRFLHFGKTINSKSDRRYGYLTITELHQARNILVKLSQQESFSKDFQSLIKIGAVDQKSRLLSLTPFIDNGIIRVGGRLKHSPYSFNKKHPAVLCPKHPFTYLVLKHEHKILLHGGPQLLLSNVRENYWPLAGKNLAKRVVRECLTCFRFNPKPCTPLMGNLPEPRVTPRLPFSDVGIDYAGPFQIKDRKGRGCKIQKCYLALFICLTSKAVHLEVVTELSTQAFMETFQRFIARRGKPLNVYSDNGSNFVGAHNQLKELGLFLETSASKLKAECEQTLDINWHFIAAYSPHHGGIWEAGIKSAKFHIKRVLANTVLTFESFYSIVTQIESVLNSRPLTPLSSDPNDLNVLTPAHLLIGRSLQAIPYPDLRDTPQNRLSHFEQLELLKQHFWSRWTKEYIGQLQQKLKWKVNVPNITVGTMVIVRDDNLPPFRWRLGRIIELHPGDDKVVRVVSIKTSSGIIKRAVVKVCPLPISDK